MRTVVILAMRAEARTAAATRGWRPSPHGPRLDAPLAANASISWIQAGPGAVRTDRAARAALAEGAELLVSLGVSGGLDPVLRPGDLAIASEVVDAGDPAGPPLQTSLQASSRLAELLRQSGRPAMRGPVAATHSPLSRPGDKADLFRRCGALCVDMESLAAGRAATETGTPFLCLRAVSDPAERGLPRLATQALAADGSLHALQLIRGLALAPWTIFALARLGSEFSAAKRSLALAGRSLERLAVELSASGGHLCVDS
ncbi:MAG: hypothetical protein ACOCVM_00780 [Desulfovibrionaceae bacterium]